jgi:hypothetical protein
MPPYLAGREEERKEFLGLLKQDVILENLILTGLRGVGKTVLLDAFKPLALQQGWIWAGADISESVSITEENLAVRLMTDLALVTSGVTLTQEQRRAIGFGAQRSEITLKVDYAFLLSIYRSTAGLVADRLRAVLEFAWSCFAGTSTKGIIFAYDEAQNLADHAEKDQYPLSLLLDVFQSIQKKDIPIMLVLTGLPTLFPKLVEARTFAERMFHVVFLDRLEDRDSRKAIEKPIEDARSPLKLEPSEVGRIVELSGGYPYFIQFLGREAYGVVLQQVAREGAVKGGHAYMIPFDEIVRKLDNDFFAGRWARATDRQREFLTVIASLPTCDGEFAVQEVVEQSRSQLQSPFSPSHTSQMLAKLCEVGLIYKNRHGKYSFAVPLFDRFIKRQLKLRET